MPITSDVFSAFARIRDEPTSIKVFRAIIEQGGKASGWAIAKSQDTAPQVVEKALGVLRDVGVTQGMGSGLDGYYYLTGLGLRVRELLLNAVK